MICRFIRLAAAVLFVVASAPLAGAADALAPAQRQAIEAIVHDYILAHPEVIGEALSELQKRQEQTVQESKQTTIAELRASLPSIPADFVKGPAEAKTTIVEFFDYRCPYCKVVAPRIDALLQEDKDVKVVLMEFPILGDESLFASRAAIAARAQGRYLPFHEAMLAFKGQLTHDTVLDIARKAGIDAARLEQDMKSPDIDAMIRRNYDLADRLGITGTPAFIIGNELIPGAIDLESLRDKIKKARAG